MDPDIKNKLDAHDAKLDAIHKSVEKTRRYFVLFFWVTVIGLVLPLIGIVFVVPKFLNTYTNTLRGL